MSVTDWSALPDGNATADPSIPAVDGASARAYSALLRGVMAKNAALALDQGGALSTTGVANAYAVRTNSGFATLKPGGSICFRADRDSTDAPTLNVDGNGPCAWLAGDGSIQPPGAVRGGLLYTVAYASIAGQPPAWISVGTSAAPIGGLVLSAARDPALPEVAPGRWTVWTNTATGRTSIWANLSGVLVDLLNAPAF